MCSAVKTRHPGGGLSVKMLSEDEDRCTIPVQVHVNGTALCTSKTDHRKTDFDELRVIDIGSIPHLGIVNHGEYCGQSGGGAINLLEHEIKVEDKRVMGTPLEFSRRQSKFTIQISRRHGVAGEYDLIELQVVKGRGDDNEQVVMEEAKCWRMFEQIKWLPDGSQDELMRVLSACKSHDSYEQQRSMLAMSSVKKKKSRSRRTKGMMGNTLAKALEPNHKKFMAESSWGRRSARKFDKPTCKSLQKVAKKRFLKTGRAGAAGSTRANLMVNLGKTGERADASDFADLRSHRSIGTYKNVKRPVISTTPKRTNIDRLIWRRDVTKTADRNISGRADHNNLPSKFKQLSDSFHGFANLGNTCYMGSVLRGLANSHDFSKVLCTPLISERFALRKKTSIANAFIELLNKDSLESRKTSLNPRPLKILLGKKYRQFAGSAQQDAHEFLRHLLEEIQDELLTLGKRAVTFQSKIKSTLVCSQCGDKRDKSEEFEDLSLDLPKKQCRASISTLLEDYFHSSKLEYVCEKCEHNVVEKTPMIARLPNTLILHFKRFCHSSNVFNVSSYSKRCDHIKIPEVLDLSRFVTDDVVRPSPNPADNLIWVPAERIERKEEELSTSVLGILQDNIRKHEPNVLDTALDKLPKVTTPNVLPQKQFSQPTNNQSIPSEKNIWTELVATPEVARSGPDHVPSSFSPKINDHKLQRHQEEQEAHEKKFKEDMRLAVQASLRNTSAQKPPHQIDDSTSDIRQIDVPFLVSPIRAAGGASLTNAHNKADSKLSPKTDWLQVKSRVEETSQTFINPSSSETVAVPGEAPSGFPFTPKHDQTGDAAKECLGQGIPTKLVFGKRASMLDSAQGNPKRVKITPKTSPLGRANPGGGMVNPGGGCPIKTTASFAGEAALERALRLSKLEAIQMNEQEDERLQKAIQMSMREAGMTTAPNCEKKSKILPGATPAPEKYFPQQFKGSKEEERVPQSAPIKRREGRSDCKYKLQAVIHHHGMGAGRGHYTTDVRRTKEGGGCAWEHHDDAYVSKTRLENVIGEKSQRTAYIVFFSYFSDPQRGPS